MCQRCEEFPVEELTDKQQALLIVVAIGTYAIGLLHGIWKCRKNRTK